MMLRKIGLIGWLSFCYSFAFTQADSSTTSSIDSSLQQSSFLPLTDWAMGFGSMEKQLMNGACLPEKQASQQMSYSFPEALGTNNTQTNFGFSFDSSSALDKATIRKRSWLMGGANVALYGGMMIGLYNAWYSNYPQGKLHSFDDSGEWLQVDKIGHAYSAYWDGRGSMELWKWTGVSKQKYVWIGGLTGFSYQTVIEVLDGFSEEWGWSWSDMAANTVGTALLIGQELGWNEQRITWKFSITQRDYGATDLNNRANKLFGKTIIERLVKDYNAQTYWLSANIKSFFPKSKLPGWLNIAVGYGADGMFGGYENYAVDKNGVVEFDRRDVPRIRQWYLSPDIDFSRIKTKNRWVRRLLFCLNALKMPAPALEFSNGSFKMNWFHF